MRCQCGKSFGKRLLMSEMGRINKGVEFACPSCGLDLTKKIKSNAARQMQSKRNDNSNNGRKPTGTMCLGCKFIGGKREMANHICPRGKREGRWPKVMCLRCDQVAARAIILHDHGCRLRYQAPERA